MTLKSHELASLVAQFASHAWAEVNSIAAAEPE